MTWNAARGHIPYFLATSMEGNDLWRVAAMLIQKHGEDAEAYASVRAGEALQYGNSQACDAWKCIAEAVHKLEPANRH